MKLIKIAVAICLAGSVSMTALAGEKDPKLECEIDSFKRIEADNISQEQKVFILDQVTKDNYDQMKTGIGASVPGYFTGNYDQFKEKREHFRSDYQLNTEQKYSRQYFLSTLDNNGLKAYNNCLKALRKETELLVYRAENTNVDKAITFTVDLDTQVALQGPLTIEVSGAGKLLSPVSKDTTVTQNGDELYISMPNLVGKKQFKVTRADRREAFEVTAQIAGVVAEALQVGPYMELVTDYVTEDISARHTINYLARRLVPGTDQYDFVWALDGASRGDNSVPRGQTFVGNACLCPSGEVTSWDSGFRNAGLCVPPTGSSKARLLTSTVKMEPKELTVSYSCGGQVQEPAKLVSNSETLGVCYQIQLSLNAPGSGSVRCDVTWQLTGKVRRQINKFVVK